MRAGGWKKKLLCFSAALTFLFIYSTFSNAQYVEFYGKIAAVNGDILTLDNGYKIVVADNTTYTLANKKKYHLFNEFLSTMISVKIVANWKAGEKPEAIRIVELP